MSDDLSNRIYLYILGHPGSRARRVADALSMPRRRVNQALYTQLNGLLERRDDFSWWPVDYPGLSAQQEVFDLHVKVTRCLSQYLARIPERIPSTRPLDLALRHPLPPKCRFYVFALKGADDPTNRPYINLTVGVSGDDGLRSFDRSGGYKPMVVGYESTDEVFVLWDADIYDVSGGFKYNRFCYVAADTILGALATGVATEARQMRKPDVTENVVACRSTQLHKGLLVRRDASIHRSLG